jgi:hypothetical protein
VCMFIDLFEEEKENPDEFVSFIVFEPASLRIPDNALLLVGDQVEDLFQKIMSSDQFESNIQDQTLLNRLNRIEMMLDLLKSKNGLVLTKFLSKIWRRYGFFSNLGELFVSQKDLKRFASDYKFNESLVLDRVIESEDSIDEDDDSDDSAQSSRDADNDKDATATSSEKTN